MTVLIKSAELRDAIHSAGYKQENVCHKVGVGRSYLSRALQTGKINSDILNRVCEIIGESPAEFAEGHKAPKRPYRRIPVDECQALIMAIVQQAKQDFMMLYSAERKGESTVNKIHGYVTSAQIVHELNADWFKNHIMGRLTENEEIIDKMLEAWKQEAEEGNKASKRPMNWI